MMNNRLKNKLALIWKIPLALSGVVAGIALLLLIAAACVLYVPSLRSAVLEKAIALANDKTDYDIDLGSLYLSPFHHSPMRFYRAYKGEEDLPLQVDIDSLFVGHRGQDTLIYTRSLHLSAKMLTSQMDSAFSFDRLTEVPIDVERLQLDETTFHSDSMIEAVGIDAIVNHLQLNSPQMVIAEGKFPLHGLQLFDADIAIDLRETQPDTTAVDTVPLLMAFDVPDGELRNVRFHLTPMGMDVKAKYLAPNVLADVGANLYDVRQLNVGGLNFSLDQLSIPIDTIYGNVGVDLANNHITSHGLYVRSDEMGAKASLHTTEMNLETMRVNVAADAEYQGSKARLSGYYDIDDEAYDMHVNIERVNLSPFLKDSVNAVLAGDIHAAGHGIDPSSKKMKTNLQVHLTEAVYDNINVSGLELNAQLADKAVDGTLHLPVNMSGSDLRVQTVTEHQFNVSQFMTPERIKVDYHSQMYSVRTYVAGKNITTDTLRIDFTTDSSTSLGLTTKGLDVALQSPMHVMKLVDKVQTLLAATGDSTVMKSITSLRDLTMLDTIRHKMPELNADIALRSGSPIQPFLDDSGLDIDRVELSLNSDTLRTDIELYASIPEIYHPEDSTALRLPASRAALNVAMTEGRTNASLTADTRLTDGAMSMEGLCSDVALRINLERAGKELQGTGKVQLDSISYGDVELGNHAVDVQISPSEVYENSLRADVQLDDLPMDMVESFMQLPDIDINGAIRATASIDGLPNNTDISAEVQPLGVSVEYKPYQAGVSLDDTPIIMSHNKVDLNGLPIYGADSTFLSLTGGLDLNSMKVDVTLAADSFAPVKLPKGGPIPVYGELATDVHGTVSGPLDSILANVDVTVLPTTDITYPIDKKNLAQVKPHGTVNVRYGTADGELNLGGRINVDDGVISYSPKLYPVMPFKVDSGSHVLFNGPVGKTLINVSASQKVKADVESKGEETRRVDFTTGVRVNGELDSLGLKSIGFFLEAPADETITAELAKLDEDTRDGLAATLLATGMYVGESNEAAHRSGYALTSIINSRINAAMANSKLGKFVDIDISSGQTKHATGRTNDMNISISKSFLKDRLRITLGTTLTDNPEVNDSKGVYANLTADYKLTKEGNVSLLVFSQRDYNNIFEGELYKSGIGVRAFKEWPRQERFKGDTISRVHGLTADAAVAYRSNNSIGPDLTLKYSIKNLLGNGESFILKGNGSYYWALRNRHPGDPKKTDTYKFGLNASLIMPYLHWLGDKNPDGDTRYMFGYQYENIAGGYGVHKLSGSFTYFFHSPRSQYITHAFTPFSLSVVTMKAESDSLLSKTAEYPQLIQLLAGDEFVPSVGYNFIYDDYRAKRAVNTYINLGVKESGNLMNSVYCIFGYKWNDKDKPLGNITFNQFVKFSAEFHNKFNLSDKFSIAIRLYAGANVPLGNSQNAPLSESFYTGGPNSLRAATSYSYGPGNFYSAKYNQSFFHTGDVKLEANFEFRFPIYWKIFGAAFVDAGNVWNWRSADELFKEAGIDDYVTRLQLPEPLYDGIINNPYFARQIALGTGLGLRLDLDGLVVRLDFGVAIHAPYKTFRYDKDGKPDYNQPINTYFNIPSALDALRINFGIGYPF